MEDLEHWTIALMLGVPRLAVVLILLPLMRPGMVSKLQKSVVMLVLCIPMIPSLLDPAAQLDDASVFVVAILIGKECVVGLLLGFALAIPFWAVEAAGFFIDNQRGAAVASMFNASSGSESSAFGILFQQAYLVLYLTHGGLASLLGLYYKSYQVWPVGGMLPTFSIALADNYLGLFDELMRNAVVWCAPAMIAMLIAELGLALASMFAPQLQVFSLAMGIKSGVAVFILMVYADVLTNHLQTWIVQRRSASWLLERLMQ